MATSTFDRRIEITDSESVKKLLTIMAKEPPKDPISRHPYTEVEREKQSANKAMLNEVASNDLGDIYGNFEYFYKC